MQIATSWRPRTTCVTPAAPDLRRQTPRVSAAGSDRREVTCTGTTQVSSPLRIAQSRPTKRTYPAVRLHFDRTRHEGPRRHLLLAAPSCQPCHGRTTRRAVCCALASAQPTHSAGRWLHSRHLPSPIAPPAGPQATGRLSLRGANLDRRPAAAAACYAGPTDGSPRPATAHTRTDPVVRPLRRRPLARQPPPKQKQLHASRAEGPVPTAPVPPACADE